jgi:hypothetical protein
MLVSREWDSMSVHSDHQMGSGSGSVLSAGAAGGVTSPPLNQGASVDYIRDLLQKRIITLTYIRNIHQGQSHWFHTVFVSRQDLDRVFNNQDMKKRTHRFGTLGMSLSNLLDLQNATDLLRGLIATLSEYDQTKEDTDKPKMRLFKGKGKRQTGAFAEYTTSSYSDAADSSYVVAPHLPFQLDYHQVLLSLLDIVSETYSRISKFLGPSPFPRDHAQQYMLGPLGLLTPHPGVSYLFAHPSTSNHTVSSSGMGAKNGNTPYMTAEMRAEREDPGSLWSIANGAGSKYHGHGGAVSPPPGGWTQAMGEMVLKVDGKFKKLTSLLLKELDTFARNSIQDELASLDPLHQNARAPPVQEVYEFE